LEGEGERRRHPFPLPPRVGDPAVRGWVYVVVCVLGGALAAGLFVCWLAKAWHLATEVGSGPTWLAERSFGVGHPITLKGVRVERIVEDFEAGGGRRPRALIVQHSALSIFCALGKKNAIGDVRVGDIISIRSDTGPAGEASNPMLLLRDCQVIEVARQPGGER